jgi:DNA-binding XRE family transcriptional regulator
MSFNIQNLIETRAMTLEEKIDKLVPCLSKQFDEINQEDDWQNQVAKDLNVLATKAVYELENHADEDSIELALASARLVKRVQSFENIEYQ